ncbi:hypothetical protein [Natronospora cellulosivora (SeqCode)]
MQRVNWKSKKDMIIENAKSDPFLSIEDIAELAKTSSSYVRTILSESNLSLMKLRKEYAHKIEEKNNNIEKILFNYLESNFLNKEEIFLKDESIINNTQDISSLASIAKDNYQSYSFRHVVNQETCCISTIVFSTKYQTEYNESKNQEDLSIKNISKVLAQKSNDGQILFSNISLDIELANQKLSNIFVEADFLPVFSVKQYIIEDNKYIGLMVLYFNNHKVSLALNEKKGFSINLKN